MRVLCSLTLALLLGCGAGPTRESIPYRFRQSLLTDGSGSGGFVTPQHRTAPASRKRAARREVASRPGPALHRCRRLRGRRFNGPRADATLALIRACTGQSPAQGALHGDLDLRRQDPRPGDLVLFHNTRDSNRNRKADDRYTAAAVVVAVKGPRVHFLYLHPRSGRARLGTMNLVQPNRRRGKGAAIQNTFLRVKRPADPVDTRYLAGQLLAGFASLPGEHGGRL